MEYTTDHRALDCFPLAKINGAEYYEVHTIVRELNGVRETVGLASAWPIISRDARIHELTALLSSTIQHVTDAESHVATLGQLLARSEELSIDSECHVAELLSRLSVFEEQLAARDAEIANLKAAPAAPIERTEFVAMPIPPQVEQLVERLKTPRSERDCDIDGKVACDYPGCTDRVKPRGLPVHKRQAHGVTGLVGHKGSTPKPVMDERRKCPHCNERPKMIGMQAHIERKHPEQITIVAAPPLTEISFGEAPWRCAECELATHARSLANPLLCIKCVVAATDAHLSNGHQVAA